jgi:hypothetical protein
MTDKEIFTGSINGTLFVIAVNETVTVIIYTVITNFTNFSATVSVTAIHQTIAIIIQVVVTLGTRFLRERVYCYQA